MLYFMFQGEKHIYHVLKYMYYALKHKFHVGKKLFLRTNGTFSLRTQNKTKPKSPELCFGGFILAVKRFIYISLVGRQVVAW